MTTTKKRKQGKNRALVEHAPYGVFAAMARKLGKSYSAVTLVNSRQRTSAEIERELLSFKRNPTWWMRQNKRFFAGQSKAA